MLEPVKTSYRLIDEKNKLDIKYYITSIAQFSLVFINKCVFDVD